MLLRLDPLTEAESADLVAASGGHGLSDAQRRRIVEAADAQRRRIERELHAGAGRRLETVAALLAGAGAVERELADARVELEEFARGVRPSALADGGLMPALVSLAERSPIPVELTGAAARLPEPVEAALYFVCSEALANAAKHASARRVRIEVRPAGVAVEDDGVGGADPAAGSGLRGLADRVDALGGSLRVTSPRGGGTRVEAELPVSGRA
jgi:signal transduction histidine kinase